MQEKAGDTTEQIKLLLEELLKKRSYGKIIQLINTKWSDCQNQPQQSAEGNADVQNLLNVFRQSLETMATRLETLSDDIAPDGCINHYLNVMCDPKADPGLKKMLSPFGGVLMESMIISQFYDFLHSFLKENRFDDLKAALMKCPEGAKRFSKKHVEILINVVLRQAEYNLELRRAIFPEAFAHLSGRLLPAMNQHKRSKFPEIFFAPALHHNFDWLLFESAIPDSGSSMSATSEPQFFSGGDDAARPVAPLRNAVLGAGSPVGAAFQSQFFGDGNGTSGAQTPVKCDEQGARAPLSAVAVPQYFGGGAEVARPSAPLKKAVQGVRSPVKAVTQPQFFGGGSDTSPAKAPLKKAALASRVPAAATEAKRNSSGSGFAPK